MRIYFLKTPFFSHPRKMSSRKRSAEASTLASQAHAYAQQGLSVTIVKEKPLRDEEEYVTERILEETGKGGKLKYLVKWQGYDEETWEPAANIRAPKLIAAFERRQAALDAHPAVPVGQPPPVPRGPEGTPSAKRWTAD